MQTRRILVTGASRGIGNEAAKILAGKGHNVIVTARTSKALDNLKEHSPERIKTITADLATLSGIRQISGYFQKSSGGLDGVIHNAGLLINRPFDELTDSDWQTMIDVNLMGPVRLTANLKKQLNKGCHIVNISSMGGFQGSSKYSGLTGYSVTKGALSILTECLAVELADLGVRVNCLCLGTVQTEMLRKAFPGMNAPVTANEMGTYIAEFLLQGLRFFNGKILPVALSDPE